MPGVWGGASRRLSACQSPCPGAWSAATPQYQPGGSDAGHGLHPVSHPRPCAGGRSAAARTAPSGEVVACDVLSNLLPVQARRVDSWRWTGRMGRRQARCRGAPSRCTSSWRRTFLRTPATAGSPRCPWRPQPSLVRPPRPAAWLAWSCCSSCSRWAGWVTAASGDRWAVCKWDSLAFATSGAEH